jgi:phosphatidylglycerophosphatase A
MKKFINWLCLGIASTFFSGFLLGKITGKKGAGAGTVASIIAFLAQLYFLKIHLFFWQAFGITLISFFVGLSVLGLAGKLFLSQWGPQTRHNGEKTDSDFNELNWDEIVGQFVAGLPIFFFYPPGGFWWMLAALFLFRVFDIFKPYPVKWCEDNLSEPYSILMDDVAAGLFSALILSLALLIF